MAAVFSINKFM